MIPVINPDGGYHLGNDHHTSNAHFHSELNHNELHHDWAHGSNNHIAHLPTDPHALAPHPPLDAHALDTHSHHALDAHAPLEPTSHSFALSDEIQKHFVGAHETTHNAHALSFGATYTKNGHNIPAITVDEYGKMYRTQHDGSQVELCHAVRDGDQLLICPVNAISQYDASTKQYCHINQDGYVYADILDNKYIGKVQEGMIYNSNNHFIGYADTPAQGAAHLYFLRA